MAKRKTTNEVVNETVVNADVNSATENVNMNEQNDSPVNDSPDSTVPAPVGETRPVLDPLNNPLWFKADDAARIRAGIDEGHIFSVPAKVTIRAGKSKTEKDEVQPFIAYFALDFVGMGLLCGGKEEPAKDAPETGDDNRTPEEKKLGACDHFNYGFGLKMFQNPIRVQLEDSIAGPEKEIAKRVKSLLEGHLFETEAEAREFVIAKRKAAGLPV